MADKTLIEQLHIEMQERAEAFLGACVARNIEVKIYCTRRTLTEQAVFYRQSRPRSVIEAKIQDLRTRGYTLSADVLEKVGPQNGPHVTNAAPGESWHNFGMAFDGVPILGGVAIWKTTSSLWQKYGEAARAVGLIWGGTWSSFPDYPHVQRVNGSPRFSPEEVEALCQFV